MTQHKQGLALAAIITVAVLWGLSFLSIKVSVAVIPPMTLALSRFIMASVILLVALKLVEPTTRLKLADYPMMALAGFIGVTAYFYFENNGVKLSNASTASIIVAAIPIITLLADALFFGYKLSKKAVLGVALSLAGVYFVVGADLGQLFTSGQGKGNLLMFGAVLSWVVYCMVTRSIYRKYSQLAITCYQNVFGAVTLIPFALLEKTPWQQIDANIMLNVAFLGVFCSAVGYYFYIYAMSTLGVSVTSLFINLSPVVTVAASYLLLNETITKTQLGGGLLVLLSVYLVSFSGPQPEQEQTGTISLAE